MVDTEDAGYEFLRMHACRVNYVHVGGDGLIYVYVHTYACICIVYLYICMCMFPYMYINLFICMYRPWSILIFKPLGDSKNYDN